MQKEILKKNMFAFYLSEQNESIKSQIIFGEPDPKYYTGKINWHKVTEDSYWQLGMEDVYINGESLNLCNGPCKLVIDTGTSIVTGPTDDLRKVLSKVKLNDCEDFSHLPQIAFRLDEELYSLSPEDYIIFPNRIKRDINFLEKEYKKNTKKSTKIFNENEKNQKNLSEIQIKKSSFFELETKEETSESYQKMKFREDYSDIEINEKVEDFKKKNNNNENIVEAVEINNTIRKKLICKRAFMPLNVEEPRGPLWVLGDLFLRKYFVIFDRDTKRIGIAPRNKFISNDNNSNNNNNNTNSNNKNEIEKLDLVKKEN